MKTLFERMSDAQSQTDPAVEKVARALAKADGIEICSDASYEFSSYGPKAQAAIAAMPQSDESTRMFIKAIHDATPNGEWVEVQHAPEGLGWSVSGTPVNRAPSDDIARVVAWLLDDEGDPDKLEKLCDQIWAENKKQKDAGHFVAHPYLKLIADALERGDWKAFDTVSQDGGNG